ncbi:TPR domain protein [Desulfovibrio sp. DV]|uniref:YcaO-like family protein n=1 Tax=Desulfovibrio sp. DV TaxID=1844708 RepID=UPI00094BA6BE|nr:YcaO-like family protein [Desulfovibrio sp. DV]OLN25640.1 TPR domain protein [Desulfovibrio sp. DV]
MDHRDTLAPGLTHRPKGYTVDQDKTITPAETVARAKAAFARLGSGVLAETKRIDTGRLGIPVFLSICGDAARAVMPTRKQMGKGASPEQAEASALMELAERYSFFSFWRDEDRFFPATWSEAEARFGDALIPLAVIRASVGETLSDDEARRILDLVPWRFVLVRDVAQGTDVAVPLDWFKILNEFNGSSAGNCFEESVLQGACELVERHVCTIIDRTRPTLPTIDPASIDDPVLNTLMDAFTSQGIKVWLKDFTLDLPVPTIGAIAYDPDTFPHASEIVFTAGTATSPAKAAIRALTEVAQLAGDFESLSNYEASGLPKFTSLDAAAWVTEGPLAPLAGLPGIERNDIAEELAELAKALGTRGFPLLTVDTTHPELGLSANYNVVPGFLFRERTPAASLGLFTGRLLAEEADPATADAGLAALAEIYPSAPFVPFFEGVLSLRLGDAEAAAPQFACAEALQKSAEDKGLAAFYQAHALSQLGRFDDIVPILDRAVAYCPEVKEYFNLRGVAHYKAERYEAAAADFAAALELDAGSAMDLANLGLCQAKIGNDALAVHYLEAALALDPSITFAKDQLAAMGR